MLRVDRLCVYILMFGLILLIPSVQMITFIDELCAYSLLMVALADCVLNNNWRKYSLMFLLVAIVTFYALFSIYFQSYNTTYFIIKDWAIQLKPYIPFAVFLAVSPKLTEQDKKTIRIICVINSIILSLALICGSAVVRALVFHPTYAACILFLCSMFILYCSVNPKGQISRNTLLTVILFLSFGILSFKAKYYATYIVALYFLLIYKPGIMRSFSTKHVLGLIAILAIVLAATWSKINYYFLTGNSDSFDPEAVESFARPVLYLTGFFILIDHFPFGSGLASFASSASSDNYSNIYYEYGINNVHGISPNSDESFICDAFYPTLAQFGVAGFVMFIIFWIYVYSFLRTLIRTNPEMYRIPFVIGSLCICFILFESTAAVTFTNNTGLIATSLLGIICACGRHIKQQQATAALKLQLKPRKI